jgi:hypothetical protein
LNLLADNVLGAAIAQRHARAVVFGFFSATFSTKSRKVVLGSQRTLNATTKRVIKSLA